MRSMMERGICSIAVLCFTIVFSLTHKTLLVNKGTPQRYIVTVLGHVTLLVRGYKIAVGHGFYM